MRLLIGERVLAHEVLVERLVGGRRQESGFGEELATAAASRSRKMPESVMTTSMRGRPSSASGIREAPAEPSIGVEARLGAHERQAPVRSARPRSSGCRCPTARARPTRQGRCLSQMAGEQPASLARAVGHGERARDAERIEAVHIAARRQDLRRAQQVAGGRRAARNARRAHGQAPRSRGLREQVGRCARACERSESMASSARQPRYCERILRRLRLDEGLHRLGVRAARRMRLRLSRR